MAHYGAQRAALIAALAVTTVDARRAKPPMNFVLHFPDTLRAESYNTYGCKVPGVSPNLDKFAAEGVKFEQAHVMHTQCSPSRCTMMTGRYMHVSGHRTQTHLIQDYEPNYLKVLKDAGYYVKWVGKNDAMAPNALNASVSEWTNSIGFQSGANAFKFGEAGFFSFLSTGADAAGNDTAKQADYRAVSESVAWMKDDPPQPFLLFLPTRGGHPPYGAPREWHNRFPVDVVKQHVDLRPRDLPKMPGYMSSKRGIPHHRNLTSLGDDTFYKIQAVYLGMLAYTDWQFGELLNGIEAAGLAGNTAVFFSSDHGDFGGDYGLVEKWPGSMADVLTRVPLVARIPGGQPGVVSSAPVQTADIFETMVDLAGLARNTSFVRFGKSFKDVAMGTGVADPTRYVYGEGGFYFSNEQMEEANECLAKCPDGLYCPRGREEAEDNGSPRAAMVRNATAKLVYRPTGVGELYDLVADPRETVNYYDDAAYAPLRLALTEQLTRWLVLTSDATPEWKTSRGLPKFPYPAGTEPWNDPSNYMAINGVSEGTPLPP